MTDQARVVVIGGGVVGASVLYHLTKKGWRDVMLLERDVLTCGSTWHAAGGFHTLNGDPNVARLQQYTVELYREIEEISGLSCGLHLTGGVQLAKTEDRMAALRMAQARGRYMGMELELVTPEWTAERFPLIDPAQFVGGLWDPIEGHLDPAGTTQAYAKAARIGGATIREKTRVEALERTPGGWRVVTDRGEVLAEHVVNAGGLWAREVGRMVGLELPVLAMEHHYLLTEEIPEVVEFNARTGRELIHIIDFEGEIYTRQEGRGILLGTYERAATPWQPRETPWEFSHELLQPDFDRIGPSLETACVHFPPFERAGIKQVINGPFTFAPDGNPLVGPVRGLPGFWCACGVMAGFSQGGGVGLALSNWMVDGDPGFDVWAMDVARYGDFATRSWTNAKVRENYSRRFRIRYPNEELPAGRPLRVSPIHDLLAAEGCRFGQAAGLEVPLWFAPAGEEDAFSWRRSTDFEHVGAEARAVREAVGILDITGFSKFRVTGAGAAEWLDRLLAARLPAPGRMTLAPMLKADGRLQGDLTLARLADDEFLMMGSGAAEAFYMRWFDAHAAPGVTVTALGGALAGLVDRRAAGARPAGGRDRCGRLGRGVPLHGLSPDRGRVGAVPCRPDQLYRRSGLRDLDAARLSAACLPHAEGGGGAAGPARFRPEGAERAAAGEELGRVGARVSARLHPDRGGAGSLCRLGQGGGLRRQGGRHGGARPTGRCGCAPSWSTPTTPMPRATSRSGTTARWWAG